MLKAMLIVVSSDSNSVALRLLFNCPCVL